jgi:amino acid permease
MLSTFPNLFVAFAFHFNVFPIYIALENRTLRSMSLASALGIGIAGSFFLVIGVFGYLAYGNDLKDSVLANVASSSGATSIVAQLCLAILVSMSYPLIFLEYRKNWEKLILKIQAMRQQKDADPDSEV